MLVRADLLDVRDEHADREAELLVLKPHIHLFNLDLAICNKAIDVRAIRCFLMRLLVIAMQDTKLLLELCEQVLLQLLILAEDGIFVPFAELERLKAEEHLAHLH